MINKPQNYSIIHILSGVLLLFLSSLSAQVIDTFSDGDFSSNPRLEWEYEWLGNRHYQYLRGRGIQLLYITPGCIFW